MAELAIIASGAGLASLGVQILDGVTRLYALQAKIRGAPREIQQLISELESLSNIIEEYETIASARA